jgi:hypothetical protein
MERFCRLVHKTLKYHPTKQYTCGAPVQTWFSPTQFVQSPQRFCARRSDLRMSIDILITYYDIFIYNAPQPIYNADKYKHVLEH